MKKLKLAFGHHKLLWKDKDALSTYCRLSENTILTDRFGYLNKFSPWNVAFQNTEFPRKDYTATLDDIILKRAEDLLTMSRRNGKNIYISWSGGVDSTAVVLAILYTANGIYNDIKIIYTDSSIDEYPKFYEALTKFDKLELIKKSGFQLSLYWYEIAKTDYLVTGMPADQLFGSIVGQNKNLNGNSDWKDFVKIDVAINQFEEAFKHYNMPIKKLNEFLWFMNFSSKWDVVCNLIPWTCGLDKGNTISFFDTKEFQDWSVSNFDILHIYDQKDAFHYKRKMKEFIFNLFKDSEYYFKDKIGSIAYAVIYEEKNIDLNYKSKPFIALLEENDILVTKFYTKEVSTFEKRRIANAMMNRELIKYRLNN